MEIRPFKEEDFLDFLEMGLALWPDCSKEALAIEFPKFIIGPNRAGFICRENGQSIGFVAMTLRFDYVPQAKISPVGYMEGIYIKEGHRKQGIAKKLCEAGEKWVKSKGIGRVGSDTWDWNRDSIEFHKKLGYIQGDTLVHFIKNISPKTALGRWRLFKEALDNSLLINF